MIYGKNIRLRALEKSDLPHFVEWLNDREVIQGLLFYNPMSLAEEEIWYEQQLKLPSDEHPMVIEAKTEDGWKIIGDTGFFDISHHDRAAEVGILIGDKSCWNKGYGAETMRLMLRHGFNDIGFNRIYLRVFETNVRAIKAYENAGYVHEGRLRQDRFLNGKFIDVLIMSVLRSEWKDQD